ncbi:MAG: hypothetical protein GY834_02310 [Bacteroidetes bacterium]|nr:hypothetical protein [Bacteroidota bacterium]
MTANKSSRNAWNYEGTPGTAAIDGPTSTSYKMGVYDESMDKSQGINSVSHPVKMYYDYSSREGKLTKLDRKLENFSHFYCPITPQWLSRFLKNPGTGTPITIGVLNTGKTYPITFRHEQLEGTTPTNRQAVGCYTVGVTATAASNIPFNVEEEFAYMSIEDLGDNVMLTTAPITSPGCDVAGAYNGTPEFTWNSVSRPEVVKVVYNQKQIHKKVFDPATDTQEIHLYEYESPKLIVNAILESDVAWDDFIDREARTSILKVLKPDYATYIEMTFTNCLITSHKETGRRNKGHYEVQFAVEGEAISATANSCNTDFGTHYRGVVT